MGLLLPKTIEDEEKKATNPWWLTRKLVDNYTKNKTELMYASSIAMLDESMSVFMPWRTKLGNMTNLSYLIKKPEPLGGVSVFMPLRNYG